MSASAVVARAGVSRKTFYDLFANREECFMAVLEEILAEIVAVVAPAHERESTWSERLRAALIALVELLEREPKAGMLVLSYLLGYGRSSPELRAKVLARVQGAVDEGRLEPIAGRVLSPLTAEGVVASVTVALHTRLQTDPTQLRALVNPLMWTVVLPYLGPAAAARQLRQTMPDRAPLSPAPARDIAPKLNMRLTYRTASTIEVIAALPGASNAEVSARVGIADQGQISKLLSRLARLGLIENTGPGQAHGAANAWQLTDSGKQLESKIRRKSLDQLRGRRGDA
jgi:AcrR family transcriptional regulator